MHPGENNVGVVELMVERLLYKLLYLTSDESVGRPWNSCSTRLVNPSHTRSVVTSVQRFFRRRALDAAADRFT